MALWEDGHLSGLRSAQPAASSVGEGVCYLVTDEGVMEQSVSGTWTAVGSPSTLADGDIPASIARDSEVTSAISTHAGDADAHHDEAHATAHASGGADAVKLDDLAAPDDNTDLDATSSAHGLLPKLSGTATEYLDGSGSYSTPAGSGPDPTGVTDGYVWTADGADGADWEAVPGGGSAAAEPWPIPRFALWAHRGDIGSSDSYPEHTLEAALQAILKGCDGVELDVRLSSDGTFYQMHDSTVDRTTDGTGAVSSKTDAQMDALAIDGGYGYDAGRHGTSLTVPTLAACLDALKPYDCTIKIQLNDSSTANANQLADEVAAAGLGHRCILEVDTVAEATEIKSVDSTLVTMVNVTASGATGSSDVDWLSVVDSSVTNLAYSTGKAPQGIGAYVSISDYGSSEATTFQNMWDRGAAAFQTNDVDSALALRKALLFGGGSAVGVGYEYDYTEATSGVNITATVEASATTVITATGVAFDGATTVLVEFFSPHVRPDTGGSKNISLFLFDGSSSIGKVHFSGRIDAGSEGQSSLIVQRLTPSAATHTYSIRGIVSAGTGSVSAGAGGSGNDRPMFIRITKAN